MIPATSAAVDRPPARLPPALVLAAGLGTRARPLTWLRAKPALPVAGATVIERIIRWLVAHGVGEVIVNLHHRPETIASVLGDGARLGVRVRYSWEQPLLGSGGGPARAFSLIEGDELLIVNGDTLTDVDLRSLYGAHAAAAGTLVTMALVANPFPDRYGGVQTATSGAVERFTRRGHVPPGWHFVGAQVARREAFDGVATDGPSESVGGIYPRLIHERPGSVRGWVTAAQFEDIGTPAVYLETCVRTSRGDASKLVEHGAVVARTARLSHTVCWSGAVVEDEVDLESCIVCSGAIVRRGSRYHRAVLLPAGTAPAGPHDTHDGALSVSPID